MFVIQRNNTYPIVLVVLVSVLAEVARVLVAAGVIILVQDVELLGVVVGEAAGLQPVAHVLVVLVSQGDVLRDLHDPLDGVDFMLHHHLQQGGCGESDVRWMDDAITTMP